MNRPHHLTRKTAPSALLDTSIWPLISTEGMSDQERLRMEHWQAVMVSYVRGASVSAQLSEFHLSRRQLLRHFNRCIQVDIDGRLMGWRGLLPNSARISYVRSKPVGSTGSATGALQQLFKRIPDIQEYLISLILKRPLPEHIHEALISNKDLHQRFLERCREAGLKGDEWPFNRRWKGRRAIDSFVSDVVATHDRWAVAARYGDVAGSKMLTGTGQDQAILAFAPLDVGEMDAHRMDLIGTIGLPTNKGKVWVAIERILLILICDAAGTSILGYYAVVRRECSSEDILAAAVPSVKEWKPRTLQPGMEYAPGGGLPLGVVENLKPFGVCALMVDNALINYGWAVVDRLMGRWGNAVNFGPVRKWMRRPLIERIFCALEAAGFQRVVSTMGSSPKDPRRSHPVKAAVKHRVDLELVLDLIDLQIARYNSETSEGCFGLERLDTLRQIVDPRNGRTLFPALPPPAALSPELDVLIFRARITGSIKRGRRPRIKFKRALYTNPTIAQSPHLIGEPVVLHVRPDDIRSIEVFLKNSGASLGAATVGGPWRLQPHSLEFRKLICAHIDDGRLRWDGAADPVTAMHRLLAKQAKADHNPANPKISKPATVLARECRATGLAPGALAEASHPDRSKTPDDARPISHHAPRFVHRVGEARHVR